MNPALGAVLPLFAGDFNLIWVYLVGPLLGGALAAAVCVGGVRSYHLSFLRS